VELDNEQGLWQEIVKFKYIKEKSICTVKHRQSDSPIQADLLKIRKIYLYKEESSQLGMGKRHFFGKIFGYMINLYICFSLIYLLCANNLISLFLKLNLILSQ
jgi:hypothetical protein